MAWAWLLCLLVPGRAAAERVSEAQDPPPLSVAWGSEYRRELEDVFERLVEASRWPLLRRRVRLVYLADRRMADAGLKPHAPDGSTPAMALYARSPENPTEDGEVRAGFGVFELASDADGLAFILAHELAHLGDRHDRFFRREARRYARWFRKRYAEHIESAPDSAARLFHGLAEIRGEALVQCMEEAADLRGRELAERAGYAPSAAVRTARHMEDWALALNPDFRDATHGSPEERAEALEDEEPEGFHGLRPCRGLLLRKHASE